MTGRRVFTIDRYTKFLLSAITVLLSVIAVELWVSRPSSMPVARAQVPDSGLQRNQQMAGIRETNRILGEILEHLRAKPIKVKILDPDKAEGDRTAAGRS